MLPKWGQCLIEVAFATEITRVLNYGKVFPIFIYFVSPVIGSSVGIALGVSVEPHMVKILRIFVFIRNAI